METNNHIPELIVKYLEGTLNNNEKPQLDQWIHESDENLKLFKHLTDPPSGEELAQINEVDNDANWEMIKQMYPVETMPVHFQWKRLAAAVIIPGVILSIIVYHYLPFSSSGMASVNNVIEDTSNITTSNKAVLKRKDGTVIQLDQVKNGIIAKDSNLEIIKVGEGKIEYHLTPHGLASNERMKNNKNTSQFDSVVIPRGAGGCTILLPDGTQVLLKPASSLYFPTDVSIQGRNVRLSGEAYFEVSKRFLPNGNKITFCVLTNRMKTEVLGTHFYVTAYDKEPNASVILEEGSVNVITPQTTVQLKPGEQAQLDGGGKVHISSANMSIVAAGKSDQIIFNGNPLDSIMRVVSRYYDVDFECTKKCTDRYHSVLMLKEPLETFLKGLNNTGEVHFVIRGRKIVTR